MLTKNKYIFILIAFLWSAVFVRALATEIYIAPKTIVHGLDLMQVQDAQNKDTIVAQETENLDSTIYVSSSIIFFVEDSIAHHFDLVFTKEPSKNTIKLVAAPIATISKIHPDKTNQTNSLSPLNSLPKRSKHTFVAQGYALSSSAKKQLFVQSLLLVVLKHNLFNSYANYPCKMVVFKDIFYSFYSLSQHTSRPPPTSYC